MDDTPRTISECKEEVDVIREWINSQQNYPKDIEDRIIHRFLHSCFYNVENTKLTISSFFSIRSSAPELILNRDPHSEQMIKSLKIVNLATLKISGNRNLWIWQLNDPGLDRYDYVQDAKIFFLAADSWMLTDDWMEVSDIVIIDVKDISLKFITKFNLSVARKLAKYEEDAIPIRITEIHVVNAPPFIDKLFSLIKPIMKQDYCNMIFFHPPKSDSLLKKLNPEDVPEDYGGTNGKMADHMVNVKKMMEQHRQTLISDLWVTTDAKKFKKKNSQAEAGTFRQLDID